MNKKVMLVVLFVLVLFSMLAMAVAGRSRFPLVNRAVAAVVLPVESMLTGLGNAGDGVRGYWKALTVMQNENAKLKQENIELRNANIQMADVCRKQAAERLLEREQHKSQKVVAAKVIARSFGDLRDCIYRCR